jgi:hypothetical protein
VKLSGDELSLSGYDHSTACEIDIKSGKLPARCLQVGAQAPAVGKEIRRWQPTGVTQPELRTNSLQSVHSQIEVDKRVIRAVIMGQCGS